MLFTFIFVRSVSHDVIIIYYELYGKRICVCEQINNVIMEWTRMRTGLDWDGGYLPAIGMI